MICTELPKSITPNNFENSIPFQNANCEIECLGFVEDKQKQENIREIFRNGWTAEYKDDKIILYEEGTSVAVQYRKSVRKITPIAAVIIDGEKEKAVTPDDVVPFYLVSVIGAF